MNITCRVRDLQPGDRFRTSSAGWWSPNVAEVTPYTKTRVSVWFGAPRRMWWSMRPSQRVEVQR